MAGVDVVGYSNANVDIVLKVDEIPAQDYKIKGKLVGKFPGGTMANHACAARRLGLSSAWTGTLGQDNEGQVIVEDFINYGVDISTIRREKTASTMFAVIMVDNSGERAIVVVPTLSEPELLTEEQKEIIAGARLLYTAPYKEINFFPITEWARKNNTLVAIDVELTSELCREEINEICSVSDVVIFNQAVLRRLYRVCCETGSSWSDIADILQQIVREQDLIIGGVTLGQQGSLLVNKNERILFKGFEVDTVDTTGAGDCFNAALTAGTLKMWNLEKLGVFANAAGALATTKYGSRGLLPTVNEVNFFIKQKEIKKHISRI